MSESQYTCMSLHFRDHELKVITERINLAERNFSTLLKDFVAFSAGLQSLQEKGMKLSRSVDMYSDEEYPSMKASLAGVSESIAAIQDFLGAQVSCLTLQCLICLHLKGLMSFVTISCLAYCCSMSVGCRSDLYLPSVNYIIYFIRLHESAVLLHTEMKGVTLKRFLIWFWPMAFHYCSGQGKIRTLYRYQA